MSQPCMLCLVHQNPPDMLELACSVQVQSKAHRQHSRLDDGIQCAGLDDKVSRPYFDILVLK